MTSPIPAGSCSPTPVLGISGGAELLGEEAPAGALDGALLGEGVLLGEGSVPANWQRLAAEIRD